MAYVGKLETDLETFNTKMGSTIGSMKQTAVTLVESINDASQRYNSLKESVSSAWNTSNNQMTLEAIDLVKGSVDKVGGAAETLSSTLDECATIKSNIDTIIADIAKGESIKERVDPKTGESIGYSSEDAAEIKRLTDEVTKLNKESLTMLNTVKSELDSVSLNIASTSSGGGAFAGFIDKYKNTNISEIDIETLLALCDSKKLKELEDGDSLYRYISKEELATYLATLTSGHNTRETAVLSAIGLIQAAASKGVGVNYVYGGKNIATGIDCSGFVSWAIAQAVPGFKSRGSSSYNPKDLQVKKISYSDLQPGDVLSCPGQHVMMVVKNDPATGTVVVAHAGAPVRLASFSYRKLKNKPYTALDMTNVYNNSVKRVTTRV